MPRLGQVKERPADRLVNRVGLGALAAQFPDALVERVVAEAGRREKRARDLPAVLMVRCVVALALFPSDGYDEVMRQVKLADNWLAGTTGPVRIPATTAISRARDRLGPEPLKLLFERSAVAMARPGETAGAFYRDWRVCTVDRTTLLVPDSAENAAAFGGPGADSGGGALPQIRLLGLVECGTRALLGAAFAGTGGIRAVDGQDLALRLFDRLARGILLLAEDDLPGFGLFDRAAATGADLLWLAGKDQPLPVDRELADGSYLSHLAQPGTGEKDREVRVVEYILDRDPASGRPLPAAEKETCRLVTTVLDPTAAPAAELAALHGNRREGEALLEEVGAHRQDGRLVLRSRTPDRVDQEVWGILALHRALRTFIHAAASRAGAEPDRDPTSPPPSPSSAVSAVSAVTVVRRPSSGMRPSPRLADPYADCGH